MRRSVNQAPLVRSISNILFLGSFEKVLASNTVWYIAMVADFKSFGNWTVL